MLQPSSGRENEEATPPLGTDKQWREKRYEHRSSAHRRCGCDRGWVGIGVAVDGRMLPLRCHHHGTYTAPPRGRTAFHTSLHSTLGYTHAGPCCRPGGVGVVAV